MKLTTLIFPGPSIADHQARSRGLVTLWIVLVTGVGALLMVTMFRGETNPAWIGWALFLLGIAAIFYEPRYGLYLMMFFGLLGDFKLPYWAWYPFNKNFSSAESIFYLGDAFIFSPLELYLVLTLLSWALRQFVRRKLEFRMGSLSWPILGFIGAMTIGMVYGFGRGGNLNIGLWEARPMFYMPLMYFLLVNTFTSRQQINRLLWVIMIALIIEAINGNYYYFAILKTNLEGHDRIMEHSSSIHADTFFVFFFASWLHNATWTKRYILPLFIPFVAITFLANQRRAAFIALALALLLMSISLFRYKRRLFWQIAPIVGVFALAYVGAFWNSSSKAAMPVQAIKSALVTSGDSSDASSNIYRVTENINTSFTIHQRPLTGVGFGNMFYILVPLPDISFFDWWQYITHNSILWIWMKAGIYGFMAMLFMVAAMIVVGTHTYERMPEGDYKVIALTMLIYIIMHFLYAYVDMSWDTQNMIYIGTAAGILASLDVVMSRPVKQFPPRYRWQVPPLSAPVLPLESDP